eukprot:gene22860-25890_t
MPCTRRTARLTPSAGEPDSWAFFSRFSSACSICAPSKQAASCGGWRIYVDEQGKRAWYSDGDSSFSNWSPKKEVGGVSSVARHFTVLAEDPQAYAQATRPKGQPKKIAWDEHSLTVDGKRIVVWSGEVHPFRLPNPSLWRDVIQKMKATGFNGVAFYFDWGYHSSAPGVYDFSGVRNVERALQIAEEEGMYIIARTGPYVNAELTGGGYPGWMFRNRAEARTDDPVYTAATDEWMTQINAIIARQAEIQADRLGVAHVQVAVRLRREAGDDAGQAFAGVRARGQRQEKGVEFRAFYRTAAARRD